MRRAVVCLGCLTLLQLVGVASAQPSAAVTLAPAPSQADDNVARGLYQAGKSAYEAGKFKDALQFFEQAYQRSLRPALLFNVGQSADRMRQDDKALTSFKAYLQQVPGAENRGEVQQRVDALEEAKRQRDAAAAAAAAPAEIATPPAVPSPATVAAQADDSATRNATALTSTAPPEDATVRKPITKQWWFWMGVGAVVVGGTAAALAVALNGGGGGQAPLYQGNAGALRAP